MKLLEIYSSNTFKLIQAKQVHLNNLNGKLKSKHIEMC